MCRLYGNLTGARFSKREEDFAPGNVPCAILRCTGVPLEGGVLLSRSARVIVILKHNILWDEKVGSRFTGLLGGDDTARMHVHGNSISTRRRTHA